MSGHLLLGVYVGGLLSSVALHWLYQRSAAKDEKRWRAEMKRCRDEIARLRLTDAERAFLQRERDLLDADDAGDSKDLGIINGLLARHGDGK